MQYIIQDNIRCGVIGYGSWATALAITLQKNKKELWWYIRNEEILDSVINEGRNSKYLDSIEFQKKNLYAVSDVNEVIRNCEIILIAAPSAYLERYLDGLTESLEGKFILSATKGIIQNDYITITEFFNRKYNIPYSHLGVISGPSHAEEVSIGKQTYLTVACTEEENAAKIKEMFETPTLRISCSKDVYGIEYASVLKNVYAIASGLACGLGYGDNFRAVLAAASAKEMTRFINETYPFERDTMDIAYLGDLLVTSYSSFSRNRRLGQLIGHGCTVKSALNEMTMIAEGYFSAECIHNINTRFNVHMPIADMVYEVLYKNAGARKKMKELTVLL